VYAAADGGGAPGGGEGGWAREGLCDVLSRPSRGSSDRLPSGAEVPDRRDGLRCVAVERADGRLARWLREDCPLQIVRSQMRVAAHPVRGGVPHDLHDDAVGNASRDHPLDGNVAERMEGHSLHARPARGGREGEGHGRNLVFFPFSSCGSRHVRCENQDFE